MNSLTQNNTAVHNKRKKRSLKVQEMCIFAMLATLMFCSKVIMEILPNIHLLGMFTIVYTIVYRKKALIPIYIYVLVNGLYSGFSTWWIPYLYIWTVLWAMTMLIPRNIPKKAAYIVFPALCSLHGILFGILYAPAQAVMFGLDYKQMIAWIMSGLPWDIVHAVGNFVAGMLIVPLSGILKKVSRMTI